MFKKILISVSLIALVLLAIVQPVSAGILNPNTNVDYLAQNTAIEAGFNNIEIGQLVAYIIKTALGLLAVVFLILMVYAGWEWMSARGNEEKVTKSLATIRMAIIGLIIVLGAYAITYFIFRYLPFSGSGDVNPGPGSTD